MKLNLFFPPQRLKEVWICMEISCGEAVLRWKVSVSEIKDTLQRCVCSSFTEEDRKVIWLYGTLRAMKRK